MKQDYHTRQQDLVLECLKRAGAHMTAQDVIRALADAGHAVASATVYRRLDRLVEVGQARKYVVDERTGACYQYAGETEGCEQHCHLKCTECGQLFHLSCEFVNELGEHILREHHFQIDNRRTVLYGVCEACSKGGDAE